MLSGGSEERLGAIGTVSIFPSEHEAPDGATNWVFCAHMAHMTDNKPWISPSIRGCQALPPNSKWGGIIPPLWITGSLYPHHIHYISIISPSPYGSLSGCGCADHRRSMAVQEMTEALKPFLRELPLQTVPWRVATGLTRGDPCFSNGEPVGTNLYQFI